jgi:putative transposase
VHDRYQVSCRRACALARICPNTWYYKSQARDASALRMRIREIAQARPRFGYTRIWIMLRREGWADNKKRIHRLYRLEGLQVRMRARRKKRRSLHRWIVPPASGRNEAWSMDFVHDQLVTGRAFRVLTVIDQWSRESVLLEANVALTGQSVVDALEAVSAGRSLPKAITVDMAPSSHPRRSTSGPIDAVSRSISSGPASPWRTPLSRVSTVGCATNA